MFNWCKTFELGIDSYNLDKIIDIKKQKEIKQDPNGWYLFEPAENFDDETKDVRTHIENLVQSKLCYMAVWHYDGIFTDTPHIDKGNNEKGVAFICPRGQLEITLNDNTNKEVLETVKLSGNKVIVLYHTKFMHDVKGKGDLLVFGIGGNFQPEIYFKKEVDIHNNK